jgi:hypothetical protein
VKRIAWAGEECLLSRPFFVKLSLFCCDLRATVETCMNVLIRDILCEFP